MIKLRILPLIIFVIVAAFNGHEAFAQGNLRAGASRVDITPPSDPANPPSGKYAHEKLYVRAIILDNGVARAALIGADQGGLSETIWQAASKQIASELNCPIENVVMSASTLIAVGVPAAFPACAG